MSAARRELPAWIRSPWVKWSWLLLLAVVVAQSIDYHWRRLPTSASGYFARGRVDYMQGDFGSAVGNFARAIELQPDDADAYIWRGEAYAKLHDFGPAMRDLENALRLRPDYAKSHAGYADGKAAVWDTRGAIEEYSRALGADPIYGRCYLERGKMLYDAGRWDEAATDLRKGAGLLLRGDEVTAHLLLWVARARAGDTAGATAEISHEVSRGRLRDERFTTGARFFSGDVPEPSFLAAVKRRGDDERRAEALFLAAAKRLASGDRAGALPLLRKALETDADTSYAFDRARVELEDLLLGFHVMRIDEAHRERLQMAPDIGLTITSVAPGGPAEASGIRPGAVLAAIDGTNCGQEAFIGFLEEAKPGTTVGLQIIDDAGSRVTVPLTIRPDSSAPTR